MATFEKRRNSLGEITAIRVKIRRVGIPHLSQTFPVANGTQTALKQAEKAAKAWVEEVTKGFGFQHGNNKSIKMQFNHLGMNQISHATLETNLVRRFPFSRVISQDQGNHFITQAGTPDARMFRALLLDCGLNVEEIKRLRWQHIQLNQKVVEVFGDSGIFLRQAPLTELAIEMLLSHKQRKYGLIFDDSGSTHYEQLALALLTSFQNISGTNLSNALKKEAAYRMADKGESESAICAYLGISNLEALNAQSKVSNLNQFQMT